MDLGTDVLCTICSGKFRKVFSAQEDICPPCDVVSTRDRQCSVSDPGRHECDDPKCTSYIGGAMARCPHKSIWWVTNFYKQLGGTGYTGPMCDIHATKCETPERINSFGPVTKRPIADLAYYRQRMKEEFNYGGE